jgi:hypothetical protein
MQADDADKENQRTAAAPHGCFKRCSVRKLHEAKPAASAECRQWLEGQGNQGNPQPVNHSRYGIRVQINNLVYNALQAKSKYTQSIISPPSKKPSHTC